MNDEDRPEETAPAPAPRTVPRTPDLERWLVAAPLRGYFPPGMVEGFADDVVARIDQHGDHVVLGRTWSDEFADIEAEVLDCVARATLLVAYEPGEVMLGLKAHRLSTIAHSLASTFYAARNLRLEGEGA